MDADRQVEAIRRLAPYERWLARVFRASWWDRVPDLVRGFAFFILAPTTALAILGRSARTCYAPGPRVRIGRSAIEVRGDDGTVTLAAPTAFAIHALHGGGARVVATLDDATEVELPLPEMTVAEADAMREQLSAELSVEARYR